MTISEIKGQRRKKETMQQHQKVYMPKSIRTSHLCGKSKKLRFTNLPQLFIYTLIQESNLQKKNCWCRHVVCFFLHRSYHFLQMCLNVSEHFITGLFLLSMKYITECFNTYQGFMVFGCLFLKKCLECKDLSLPTP